MVNPPVTNTVQLQYEAWSKLPWVQDLISSYTNDPLVLKRFKEAWSNEVTFIAYLGFCIVKKQNLQASKSDLRKYLKQMILPCSFEAPNKCIDRHWIQLKEMYDKKELVMITNTNYQLIVNTRGNTDTSTKHSRDLSQFQCAVKSQSTAAMDNTEENCTENLEILDHVMESENIGNLETPNVILVDSHSMKQPESKASCSAAKERKITSDVDDSDFQIDTPTSANESEPKDQLVADLNPRSRGDGWYKIDY